jgi:TRAP transporter 4TM/12TM fusion protein
MTDPTSTEINSQSNSHSIDEEARRKADELKGVEPEGRRRVFTGPLRIVTISIALAFVLFHMYRAYVGPLGALQQRGIHLAFAMALTFLLYPFRRRNLKGKPTIVDFSFAILGVVVGGYVAFEYHKLAYRMGTPNTLDLIMSPLAILLVLEATRRLIGWAMPMVAAAFLIYAYFGQYAPGFLAHSGFEFSRIVTYVYLSPDGIFGLPLGVSATYIILFIVMGAFLQESGTGTFFFDFAYSVLGRVRGGPAKMSIISSSLFGTISGSAVANVVADGWLTIPMMKRTGYRAHVAAAVEAVASTGGQLMPPVMGSAAFIMAEIVGVPYVKICIHAAIPAILFYWALFCMVDLEAGKMDLKGLPGSELPNIREVFRRGWHLLVPLVVLVYLLAVLEYSPMRSAFFAIIITPFVAFLRRSTRMDFRKIIRALEQGALGALEAAFACACAGIIIGIFSLTGLGLALSSVLIDLAGSNVLVLLFLTMIACLILGMGLPTTACYIILAVLVAPALVQLGVDIIAAHLFVFYFGIISSITPPVAMAAYVAAGIGNSSPFKTGWYASKLGLNGFIIPYMFVYGTHLLWKGALTEILLAFISGLIGSAALACAIQGRFLSKLSLWQRIFLCVAALLLIKPGIMTDLIGCGILAILCSYQYFFYRRRNQQGILEKALDQPL